MLPCSLAELKHRLLVECKKLECRNLDHSLVVAAISQWRRRLSACAGSRWTF